MCRNGDGIHFLLGRHASATSPGRHVAIARLAFKLSTNDLSDALRRALFTDLFAAEATATAYAPVFMETARRVPSHEARLI